jgi:hypothetical protein
VTRIGRPIDPVEVAQLSFRRQGEELVFRAVRTQGVRQFVDGVRARRFARNNMAAIHGLIVVPDPV